MRFEWKSFLDIAEYLQDNLENEASFRSGISRAYYSVFCSAKLFCIDEKIVTAKEVSGPQAHTVVINSLMNHAEKDFKSIGKKLQTLRLRRNEADYDSYRKGIDKKYLISTIEMSKDVFKSLDDLK